MKITDIVMAAPDFFDVAYAINPHMLDKSGQLNKIDQERAQQQWLSLKDSFEKLSLSVEVLPAQKGLYDFVFCANTFFAWNHKGIKTAITSNMLSPLRQPEVAIASEWLKKRQYNLITPPANINFEAMGDLIWNLESEEIFAGHGFRTSPEAINFLRETIPYPLHSLKLVSAHFYHLDTCFFVLNKDCAAIVENAFDDDSLQLLRQKFKQLITIDLEEAMTCFAGNAFCPDGKNVFIQAGAKKLNENLRQLNFLVHEVETCEFIKSGGSVFCLKNFLIT